MKLFTLKLVLLFCLFAGPLSRGGAATEAGSRARPTPRQATWQDMELEMFIHFAPSTWQDTQGDNLTTPLSVIDPQQLDTEQWAEVAVAMGARQIVFVAKHVGGYCWWQTDTTTYSVARTSWRGGKGDVMKDLAVSCRKRGLKLGVYLSPADRMLGVGVGGRAQTPAAQERYNKIYRQQLTELLGRYGDISEVWFDGSNVVPVGDILRRCAPKAMVFQGPQATIRWVGNEAGTARYPAWNALPLDKAKSGVATAYDGDPDGEAWLPNECDARIRADWFWSTKNAGTLKSVAQLMNMYYRSVGHGAVLLLNQTPDTSGRIPEADARRAAEFGAEIKRRFGQPLAETAGNGNVVQLTLERPVKIDHVIAMENILDGERVREYVIDGLTGGEWKALCDGTAIGHKKIDRFEPTMVERVRLRCTRTVGQPRIRKLAVYEEILAPQLPPARLGETGDVKWLHMTMPGDVDYKGMEYALAVATRGERKAVALVTSLDTREPVLEAARRLARESVETDPAPLLKRHETEWAEFWSAGGLELGDKFFEQAWYRNLYYMRCFCRAGTTMPVTLYAGLANDNPGWHGVPTLDYNIEQTFWPMFVCNQVELMEPYVRYLAAFAPRGRWLAKETYGVEGLFYPVNFRFLLAAAGEAARILGRDEELAERWAGQLRRVPDYETTSFAGAAIVANWKGAAADSVKIHNVAVPTVPIFPGEQVTWFSPPEEKALFERTLRWLKHNGNNSHIMVNVARARLSLPDAYTETRAHFSKIVTPNGLYAGWPGHGYYLAESWAFAGLTAELLLQSVGDIVRVFPAWPKARDAKFTNLRAQGGFLVSAEQKNAEVVKLEISSTAGGRLRLLSPWPKVAVNGREFKPDGRGMVKVVTAPGERLVFTTP